MIKKLLKKGYVGLEVVITFGVVMASTVIAIPYIMNSFAEDGKDMAELKNKIPDTSVDHETGYIISGGESIHLNGTTPAPEIPDVPVINPEDGLIHVDSVTANPTSLTMKLGETKNITWTVAPSNADNKEVAFRLSNRDTVTVSSTGAVTAIGVGATDITIVSLDTGVSATVHVIVTEVPSEDILLNYDKLTMVEGTSVQLEAQVIPSDTTNQTVIFSTENPDIASVTADGKVTAGTAVVGNNTTNIIVTNGSIKKIIPVEVIANRIYTTGIEVDTDFLNMYVGDTKKVTATVMPANATNKTLTYQILDTSIAVVDGNGNVTAKKAGTTALYIYNYGADFYGKEVHAAVYINVVDKTIPMESMSISYPKAQMTIGEVQTPTVSIFPEDTTNQKLTWSSNNTAAVTVDANGKISAAGAGTAVITATSVADPSISASFTIKVVEPATPVTGLIADKTSVAIKVGETVNIGVNVLPEDADNKNLIWTSSDESVAVADANNGTITGISSGVIQVKIASEDNPDVFVIIEVVVQDTPINNITIDPEAVVMDVFTTKQFVVSFDPVDASNKSLTWSVSDPEIGTISRDGLFTSKAYGTTKVIATAVNGMTAEAEVVVKEIMPDGIAFNEGHYFVQKGTCVPYEVTILPENATNKNYTITVDNVAIATVDIENKEICGHVEGETSMTVLAEKDNSVKASSFITVTPVLIEDLILEQDEMTLNVDIPETKKIDFTVYPLNAKVDGIKYISTNELVATVDESGNVTAVGVGECEIHILVEGDNNLPDEKNPTILKVNVITEKVEPTDFIIDDENLEFILHETESHNIRYHFEPANTTETDINWESDNESVAIVDNNGVVYPVGIGEAIITGTSVSGNFVDSVMVTVRSIEITSFKVEPSELLLSLTNPEATYTIEILPATAEQSYNISYDETYLDIDRTTQKIVAKRPGKTTIYFYDYEYNLSDSIDVEIMSEEWNGESDGSDLEITNGICYVRTPQQLSYLSLQTQLRPLSYTCDSVKIMNSLDMNGGNFTPFGTIDVGVDGGGNTIRNLYIANTGKTDVAFIENLSGSLLNLSIENAEIFGDNVSVVANDFSGYIEDVHLNNNKMYAKNIASTLFNTASKGIINSISLIENGAYDFDNQGTLLASTKENIVNALGDTSIDKIYIEQNNAGSLLGTTTGSTGSLNHVAFNNNLANTRIIQTTGRTVIVKNSYFLNATDYTSMKNPENVHFGKDNTSNTVYETTVKYDANGNITTSNTPSYTLHKHHEMKSSQEFVDLINEPETEDVWFVQSDKYPNFIEFAKGLISLEVTNKTFEVVAGTTDDYSPVYTTIPSDLIGKLNYTCKGNTNEAIATVSTNCSIKGLTAGNSEFIVDFGDGHFETISLTVTENIPATGFSIVEDKISERIGFNIKLNYQLTPENTTSTIIWTVKDDTIAFVNDFEGNVFGVGVGTTTITGTVYGANGEVYSDSVEVEVLPAISSKSTLVSGTIFQNKIASIKDSITTIAFKTILPQADFFDDYTLGVDLWDVSDVQDGSIMAYFDEGVLTIVGNDGVFANANSAGLFQNLTNLTTINFSNSFYTDNVTNMDSMFAGCTSLSKAEVANWNVDKVQTTNNMFANTGIISLDLSKWNTPNLTSINQMFNGSDKLAVLDASGLNVSKVTSGNATSPFGGMLRLEEVAFGENWRWVDETTRLDNPDGNYVLDAIGKWYDNSGNALLSSELPNGKGRYSAIPTSYGIEYVLNGGTNAAGAPTYYLVTTGIDVLPSATRKGYTFDGWYKTSDFGGDIVTNIPRNTRGLITLYAKWTVNTYDLKFDPNGGTLKSPGGNLMNGTVTDTVKVTYGKDSYYALPNDIPTRTGYRFMGWYSSKLAGTKVYDERGYATNDGVYWKDNKFEYAQNLTVYAKWEPYKATVVYHSGNATNIKFNETTITEEKLVSDYTQTFNYEDKVIAGLRDGDGETELFMEKTGYTWSKQWAFGDAEGNLNGKTLDQTTMVTGQQIAELAGTTLVTGDKTIHVYGQWNPNKYTYNIVYKSNSGVQLGASTVEGYFDTSTTVSPKSFTGYTSPANQTVVFDSTTAKTITFTYTPINYTISYTLNGGSVATANPTSYNIETATFTLNNPTKIGNTFLGWTGSNGSTASTNVSVTKGSTGNKTFTANWDTNEYTATFNANGGTTASPATIKKDYGVALGTLPTTSRTGYTFNGWYTATSGGTQISASTTMPAQNITYYAQWTINSYPLKIDPNGGYRASDSSTSVITVNKNYKATENISERKRTGYILIGYDMKNTSNGSTTDIGGATFTFDSSSKTGKFTQGSVPITLVAKWEAIKYTAQFDPNGGYRVSDTNYNVVSYEYTYGQTDNISERARAGYTLTGYIIKNTANGSTTDIGGATVTFNSSAKTGTFKQGSVNVTIVAQWSANSYTATFDANGGTTPSQTTITKKTDEALGTLPTTSKTGYIFAGWYTAKSGGTKITSATTMPAGNVTYYAQWTTEKFTISYNANGGTGTMSSHEIKYGETVKIKDNEFTAPTGYSFAGWTTKSDGSADGYGWSTSTNAGWSGTWSYINGQYGIADYKLVLYARWSPITYTYNIVYKSSSGVQLGTGTVAKAYGTTNSVSPKAFTGYTSPAAQNVVWNSTTAKTITFTYTPITYTISYTLDGGTVATANKTNYTIETATFALNNPTKTGYTFTGWTGTGLSSASTSVSIAKGSTGNRTYTANWNANIYKVTLNNQSATSAGTTAYYYRYNTTEDVDGTTVYFYSDANCTTPLPNGYTITKPTKTGYTFGGYFTETNGGGTQYVLANGNATNSRWKVAGDVTLYAKWTINQYTATFDANGGTTASPSTIKKDYNSELGTLPTTSQTGYTFKGWYTAKSGGTKISTTTKLTANVTYYAQWTPKTIKLTLNMNGGSGGTTAVYYKYGTNKFYSDSACTTAITKITVPSKTGYTYTQYNGDGTSGGEVNERYIYTDGTFASDLCTDITKDATLTAQWTPNSITFKYYSNGANTLNGSAIDASKQVLVVEWKATMNQTYPDSHWDFTAGTSYALTRNNYAPTGYWGTTTTGGTLVEQNKSFANYQEVCDAYGVDINTSSTTINLYAQWRPYITQYRCRNWGSWSGWQNSAVSSSSTRQVETQWIDTSAWGSWSSWQNSAVSSSSTRQVETQWIDTSYWGSWSSWQNSAVSSSSTRQVETQWIDTSAWGSWSSYSDTSVTASSTREVRTKKVLVSYKMYRYKYWNSSQGAYYYTFSDDYGGTKQTAVASKITYRKQFDCLSSDTGTIAIVLDTTNFTTNLDRSDGKCSVYTINTFVSGSGQGQDTSWYPYGYNTKTQYSYRDWKSSGYTQYRYRDYVSQGYTQYRYRDWKSSGYTQYRYRDLGSWSSWSTNDCTTNMSPTTDGRQTRYGDYGA